MKNKYLHVRLWVTTVFMLVLIFYIIILSSAFSSAMIALIVVLPFAAAVAGLPALLIYWLIFPRINRREMTVLQKMCTLFYFSVVIVVMYSLPLSLLFSILFDSFWNGLAIIFFSMLAANSIAMALNWNKLSQSYFTSTVNQTFHSSQHQTNHNMESNTSHSSVSEETQFMQKPLTKGIITGVLILVMLIPTFFIFNLVSERRERQKEVVNEVTNQWAGTQEVSGPYLYIPYRHFVKMNNGKTETETRQLILLPEELSVTGDIIPEERKRSIYKVLLYKSNLNAKGFFQLKLPKEIDTGSIIFSDVKLCVGISDFKGIQKQVSVSLNGKNYELSPGLPTNGIDKTGLSANIDITGAIPDSKLVFETSLQLRGSRQLHFVPLSGNSQFTLNSAWPNPSFDGTSLPTVRSVSNKGFTATWSFNKANLPFNTVLNSSSIETEPLSFGVSMLQPADQYAKTERSVKYALLIIGLSFSLFFIVELMQKKPLHPVQYVLMGLALVIFYSLLLSVSEFIPFDYAYLAAALATVMLITLYTKSHFKIWKTALVFGTTLSGLYGFIFVLIRLEDTALLLGSIGLFFILCGVMYVSRKINWYQAPQATV